MPSLQQDRPRAERAQPLSLKSDLLRVPSLALVKQRGSFGKVGGQHRHEREEPGDHRLAPRLVEEPAAGRGNEDRIEDDRDPLRGRRPSATASTIPRLPSIPIFTAPIGLV